MRDSECYKGSGFGLLTVKERSVVILWQENWSRFLENFFGAHTFLFKINDGSVQCFANLSSGWRTDVQYCVNER